MKKYFIFSQSDYSNFKEMARSAGQVYKPGELVHDGEVKLFTDLVSDIEQVAQRSYDYKLVASYDSSELPSLVYSLPSMSV